MLVDCPVQVRPPAGDLEVCLVGEPPVARGVAAQSRRLDEHGGKPLHPAVDGDVVDGDAPLGQQLLDVPVGQSVPQVPADRDRDHVRREPEPSEHRGHAISGHKTSLPTAHDRPTQQWPRSSSPLLADVGNAVKQLAGLARAVDDTPVDGLGHLGVVQLSRSRGLDGISSGSTA